MAKSILVVCPNLAFGELLRISLEESGQFAVRLVQTGSEALSASSRAAFDLILLDAEVRDQHFALLAQRLQEKRPDTRFILIPPENNPDHPALSGLRIHGYLNKPFYAPELVDQINAALQAEPVAPASDPPAAKPMGDEAAWLHRAGLMERLERVRASGGALAALLYVRGGIRASAGELSDAAARELAAALQRALDGQESGDMMRYFRLEASGADALLYAHRIDDHGTLALSFPAAVPVSQARSAARAAVLELTREPDPAPPPLAMPPLAELENPAAAEDDFEFDELEEVQEINLSALLSHIPSPNPIATGASDWTAEPEETFVFPWEQNAPAATSAGSTQPVKVHAAARSMADTAPRPTLAVDTAQTAYTCVLIPRLPQHTLDGALGRQITVWLPELCQSFGWRLDRTDLQPHFLQWTLRVAPAVSPGNTVRLLRRALSERIFEAFPDVRPLDPREDFWAAGYLIISGSIAPTPAVLDDFILKTRRRQGFTTP